MIKLNRRICIAPMMDWTDRHDRYFLRLISPNALMYTEMITSKALIYGDIHKHLAFDKFEHPLALQLGGNDPAELVRGAKLAQAYGYDEVNLNVGCPSDRVQSGRFGACLMLEPNLVAECIAAMTASVTIPVTVKCRIGVDEQDSYEQLQFFIEKVHQAGCQVFIIHARKAWLKGLSPKQNREVPPLQYETVRKVKQDFPHLTIVMNGGIKTSTAVEEHLQFVDGVMLGREAYSNPYWLAEVEKKCYGISPLSRHEIIEAFIPYVAEQLTCGVKLSHITRHILGLFQSQKGAKHWRRFLMEEGRKPGAGVEILIESLKLCDGINYN